MPFAEYLRAAVLEPLALVGSLRGLAGVGLPRDARRSLLALAGELLAPTLVAPETLAEATSVQFPGLVGVLPGFGRMEPNDWGLGFELRDGKSPHWTGTLASPRTFGHFGAAGHVRLGRPGRRASLRCASPTSSSATGRSRRGRAFSDAVHA